MSETKQQRSDRLFKGYPKEVLSKFNTFHFNNPQVFGAFKSLAFDMKKSGRTKYSAEIIVNVLRWHHDMKTTGDSFKLRNDFKPMYSRLLVTEHPEFETFFDFRTVKSKGIGLKYQKKDCV